MKTLTNPPFIFDKGQLKVIPLPEEPKYDKGYSFDKEWIPTMREYHKACAYARAHPVDVRPEDVNKAKIIWESQYRGVPADLTEYRVEGVRMEIKEKRFTMPTTTIRSEKFGVLKSQRQEYVQQVACLIEDDKT